MGDGAYGRAEDRVLMTKLFLLMLAFGTPALITLFIRTTSKRVVIGLSGAKS